MGCPIYCRGINMPTAILDDRGRIVLPKELTEELGASPGDVVVFEKKGKGAMLSQEGWALNATVVHETYHTLVFRRRISPNDSKIKISSFLKNQRTTFLNLTKAVSLFALDLATKTDLGGRDS